MSYANSAFLIAGIFSGIASALHIGIIIKGPAWYRFFGAGERMALLAERGSNYPGLLTGGIALFLAGFTLYAFSAIGMVPKLPLTRPALVLISFTYVLRGALGVPYVVYSRSPYALELRRRMTFMFGSSLFSLLIGLCYAFGTFGRWSTLVK